MLEYEYLRTKMLDAVVKKIEVEEWSERERDFKLKRGGKPCQMMPFLHWHHYGGSK